jgi:hypothetical protein
MSLVWPLLVGLVLAVALGGRLQRIGELRLRGLWLFYVALAFQFAAYPLRWMPWHTRDGIAKPLWLASYGVIALATVVNLRAPGVPVIIVGMLSNIAAIVTNGGHMPALPSALRGAGLHFSVSNNSARMAHPHLAWLVDRWAAPSWVPWGNVFSVGDLVIGVGSIVFALVATGALGRLKPRRPAEPVTPTA